MKIVDVKAFIVGNPAPHHGGLNWVFLKLVADDGVVGYGEAYAIPFSPRAVLPLFENIGERFFIGATDTDYNFPCVEFSEDAQRYLLTWNDGDISDEDYRGNVWGRIDDYDGDTIVDNYIIKSGNFERTDIVNYLSSSFFVSFDNLGDIFGKLVLSNGQVVSGDIQLSASDSAVADWANMAVGAGKIFVTWEDERIVNQQYPSIYGNIWNLNIPTGSELLIL